MGDARQSNIVTNGITALSFNTSRFGKLVDDWWVENIMPDMTPSMYIDFCLIADTEQAFSIHKNCIMGIYIPTWNRIIVVSGSIAIFVRLEQLIQQFNERQTRVREICQSCQT